MANTTTGKFDSKAELDATVLLCHKYGDSISQIALDCGISRRTVRRIVDAMTDLSAKARSASNNEIEAEAFSPAMVDLATPRRDEPIMPEDDSGFSACTECAAPLPTLGRVFKYKVLPLVILAGSLVLLALCAEPIIQATHTLSASNTESGK